jgi:hypothetical protein
MDPLTRKTATDNTLDAPRGSTGGDTETNKSLDQRAGGLLGFHFPPSISLVPHNTRLLPTENLLSPKAVVLREATVRHLRE